MNKPSPWPRRLVIAAVAIFAADALFAPSQSIIEAPPSDGVDCATLTETVGGKKIDLLDIGSANTPLGIAGAANLSKATTMCVEAGRPIGTNGGTRQVFKTLVL